MKYWYLYMLAGLMLLAGCDSEDKIVPGVEGEPFYTLPQGNHDFDRKIVEWNEKYGFYTLYQFEEKDIYWEYSKWSTSGGQLYWNFWAYPALPEHSGKQVELLEQALIDLYPDEFLKKMPLKVLLCSYIWKPKSTSQYVPGEGWITILDSLPLNTWKGYDYIALTGGSELSDNWTREDKVAMQYELNKHFLETLTTRYPFVIPKEFLALSDYTQDQEWLYGPEMLEQGFLSAMVLWELDRELRAQLDFNLYVLLLAYPFEYLNAEPDTSNDYKTVPSWIGAFHEDRDVNEVVRKKYDVVAGYLESLGVNIKRLQQPVFK